jgi:hypothetical protein
MAFFRPDFALVRRHTLDHLRKDSFEICNLEIWLEGGEGTTDIRVDQVEELFRRRR